MEITNAIVRRTVFDVLGADVVAILESDDSLKLCDTVQDDGMFIVVTDNVTVVASAWLGIRPGAMFISVYDWTNAGKRTPYVISEGNVRDVVMFVLDKAEIAY